MLNLKRENELAGILIMSVVGITNLQLLKIEIELITLDMNQELTIMHP